MVTQIISQQQDGVLTSPDYSDLEKAAERINGIALNTPLINSPFLDALSGARVFLKAENLQRTGSFKFRGAYNAISAMSAEQRSKGVMAVSSGNHAQGVAEAARLLGVTATIIMPADAPSIKVARTKRSGANVILYDRMREDRDALAAAYVSKHDCSFIHPYNNEFVIAGQGTAGIEICQTLAANSEQPDDVFVCTGGGGLTAGIALAMTHHYPDARVHTSEPEEFDDYRRSLEAGTRLTNEKLGGSICDAIVTPSPGEMSFSINKNLLGEGHVVSDQQALEAVAFAFNELKLVVEPGGAVALAALLKASKSYAGKTVVVLLSGGNIDPAILSMALSQSASYA